MELAATGFIACCLLTAFDISVGEGVEVAKALIACLRGCLLAVDFFFVVGIFVPSD